MPFMTLNSEPGPVQRFRLHCELEKERVMKRERHTSKLPQQPATSSSATFV